EIKAMAQEMLARAGERAASLGAGREAQRYFEQAAELTDDPLDRAGLDDRAARMAWRRGRGDEARALFGQAQAIYEAKGQKREAARILLEGALTSADDRDIPAVVIRASNNLGVVFESADRYADSISITNRAEAIARRMGDRVWESQLMAGSVSGLVLLGRWDEA